MDIFWKFCGYSKIGLIYSRHDVHPWNDIVLQNASEEIYSILWSQWGLDLYYLQRPSCDFIPNMFKLFCCITCNGSVFQSTFYQGEIRVGLRQYVIGLRFETHHVHRFRPWMDIQSGCIGSSWNLMSSPLIMPTIITQIRRMDNNQWIKLSRHPSMCWFVIIIVLGHFRVSPSDYVLFLKRL